MGFNHQITDAEQEDIAIFVRIQRAFDASISGFSLPSSSRPGSGLKSISNNWHRIVEQAIPNRFQIHPSEMLLIKCSNRIGLPDEEIANTFGLMCD